MLYTVKDIWRKKTEDSSLIPLQAHFRIEEPDTPARNSRHCHSGIREDSVPEFITPSFPLELKFSHWGQKILSGKTRVNEEGETEIPTSETQAGLRDIHRNQL